MGGSPGLRQSRAGRICTDRQILHANSGKGTFRLVKKRTLKQYREGINFNVIKVILHDSKHQWKLPPSCALFWVLRSIQMVWMHSNGAVYTRHLNALKRRKAPLTKTVTLTVHVNMLLTGHNVRFLELYDADKFHFIFLENIENVYSIINKLTSTIRPMKLPE